MKHFWLFVTRRAALRTVFIVGICMFLLLLSQSIHTARDNARLAAEISSELQPQAEAIAKAQGKHVTFVAVGVK